MLDQAGGAGGRGLVDGVGAKPTQAVEDGGEGLLVDGLDAGRLPTADLDGAKVGCDGSGGTGHDFGGGSGGESLLGNDVGREAGGLDLEEFGHVGEGVGVGAGGGGSAEDGKASTAGGGRIEI